mmetsp:Transcript_22262/g.31982  ORF Transcript_22262/g.31982 Transcript_22262/m.31982 type:complete len:311 (+) Transcript_22262:51-983(+)
MAFMIIILNILSFFSYTASSQLLQTCTEDICHGIDFDSIGLNTFYNVVPEEIIKSRDWYDRKRAGECFRNKKVLIFGDSSTQETVEELFLLLGGNATYFGDFNGHEQHRNQLIDVLELNSTLRFRWFGHAIITSNFGGVESMLSQTIEKELYCLLGISDFEHCVSPHIIVIQSSHHDVNYEEFYGGKLHLFMELLQKAQERGSKVYWKGSGTFVNRNPIIDRLNEYAAPIANQYGVDFINMTTAFCEVESFMNLSTYFSTYPHVGMNGHEDEMVFSNFLTQYFLREICYHNNPIHNNRRRMLKSNTQSKQ